MRYWVPTGLCTSTHVHVHASHMIYRSKDGTTPPKGEHRLEGKVWREKHGVVAGNGMHGRIKPGITAWIGIPGSGAFLLPSSPRALLSGMGRPRSSTQGGPVARHCLVAGPVSGSAWAVGRRTALVCRVGHRRQQKKWGGKGGPLFLQACVVPEYYMGRLSGRSGTHAAAGPPLKVQQALAIAAAWGHTVQKDVRILLSHDDRR